MSTEDASMMAHASKNESRVATLLRERGLRLEVHRSVPLQEWPWKTPRSKAPPKCDIFLPDSDIYIEVKGWMTLYSLAKSAWLAQQGFNYYFFQNDDETRDPFSDSPCSLMSVDQKKKKTIASLVRSSVQQQADEVCWFASNPNERHRMGPLTR